MSFNPFSSSEIDSIKQFFEKNGWMSRGLIENNFRYSLHKNKIIIFTLKFPVQLPVKLNIPFEVLDFKLSIVFQVWNLNQNTTTFLQKLMLMLKDLEHQVSMEHNFPLEGKEKDLLKQLNLIMPDSIKNEQEEAWINRIRISLMNKRAQNQINRLDPLIINEVVKKLKQLGLDPSFKNPWELKGGLPKVRTSETLFFSSDEPFDEFFLLEKENFTYFKDIQYNKFYIRSFFETYAPIVLQEVFKDINNFKLELLVENWIKFARVLLNSMIGVINAINFNENELVQFNPETALNNDDFENGNNNFPFSALHYESSISKELFQRHNELLNQPPSDFEVIENINFYTNAEELITMYKFEDATELLNNSLKLFNKHKQKKVVVSILLLLRKIAVLLNQSSVAINYLKTALGVAKSGEVPISQIIIIQYYLGKILYKLRDHQNAQNHFNILLNILNSSIIESELKGADPYNLEKISGLTNLYLGLINLEQNKPADAKPFLKKTVEIGTNNLHVKLKYHFLRALYFKNRNDLSQTQKLLKVALSSLKSIPFETLEQPLKNIVADIGLELGEFYIHHHKDSKKANFLMNQMRKLVDPKEIPGLKRAIRWNLLAADFYNMYANDSKKYQHYLKQSRILKDQLRQIGVLE